MTKPQIESLTRDYHYLLMAELVAKSSTCLGFQIGAVIINPDGDILSTGFNAAPTGLPQCSLQGSCYKGLTGSCLEIDKPSRAIHAEVSAIGNAAKNGIPVAGSTMYINLAPCLPCLKSVLSAGITEVVYLKGKPGGKYDPEYPEGFICRQVEHDESMLTELDWLVKFWDFSTTQVPFPYLKQ